MPVKTATELWDAWAAGRLCLQGCTECGELQHPPGPVCAHCHGTALSLADIDGAAELVTWSTVHRAPAPAFVKDVPYTIAIVQVAGATLVEARMDPDTSVDSLRVGAPVRLAIGEVAGRRLPVIISA